MKIEFAGGAGTVTGSSFIVKDDDFCIMVDCGMFQGRHEIRARNSLDVFYAPSRIDALLLTHAHIDHSGLIPKLVRDGFYGNIYSTRPTADLCALMLPDSGHIQELDAAFINRRNKRLDREPVKPLYSSEEAENCLKNFAPVPYNEVIQIHPRVKARFLDAGHILGSAIIEMWVQEKGRETKLVFSGDLGPGGQALVRDPDIVEEADVLLLESTYGDRLHRGRDETYIELRDIINSSSGKRGNIVIPAFAVERTQEIIYAIGKMIRTGEIPPTDVYIDSPMAVSATGIFLENRDCLDEETWAMINSGQNPLGFDGLHYVRTTEESKGLNRNARGAIIISASGMCTGGRIKYHLQNNLYNPESAVVFAGYQAEGTLGRRIVDGAEQVRLYGEDVAVKASIHTLGGFSGHADRDDLLRWIGNIKNDSLKLFIVHGEEKSSASLRDSIREHYGFDARVPVWGEIVDIETMKSDFIDYSDSGGYMELDGEIELIQKGLDSLRQKYHMAAVAGVGYDRLRVAEELRDLKLLVDSMADEI